MGLDTSHDCWHGPYSAFMGWRTWVAREAGIPLGLMEGFYGWEWGENDLPFDQAWSPLYAIAKECGGSNPVSWWETLKAVQSFGGAIPWKVINSPLVPLLHHSDCEGRIDLSDCLPIARGLRDVLLNCEDDTNWPVSEATKQPLWSNWRDGRSNYDGNVPATKRFIRGLLAAHRNREDVIFR